MIAGIAKLEAREIGMAPLPFDAVASWPSLALVLAPFGGSFLGVVVRRLPRGEGWLLTRSRCDFCRRALGSADLVPVASFLLRRGRCRACGARIDPFHLRIELAALAVALWAFSRDGADPVLLWLDCALGWSLLALAWIDWECMRLPDALTLPLLLAGLGAAVALDPGGLAAHALGAIAGYGGLRAVASLYRQVRRRDGVGEGDAKLLAAGGAWLGWQALPDLLLIAALLGLCLAGAQWARGGDVGGERPIPFGPPLALAMWLLWLYGGPVRT